MTSLTTFWPACQPAIKALMASGVIATKDSFGFALAYPGNRGFGDWDNPERLIALVIHWGPDGPRYVANAVRKIRPAARNLDDTQHLRTGRSWLFQDKVESKDDEGRFPWGDFPWDGAVWHSALGVSLLGAVSAFPQEQDPIVARLILGVLAEALRSK
jgi:hypothetical protein